MPRARRRPDPIADYVEWADNRYNPGYFLGGTIPPYLRTSTLGPRARRLAGGALLFSTVVGAGTIIASALTVEDGSLRDWAITGLSVALMGWAAVVMLRGRRPRSPGASGHTPRMHRRTKRRRRRERP